MPMKSRAFTIFIVSVFGLGVIIYLLWAVIHRGQIRTDGVIKIGILHSLTGLMAASERPVVDATLLAIDEINEKGGVLGKKIVPIVVDTKADWPTISQKAEKLITEEHVTAIFGCWTSASRKMVKPV